jgi:hypothetical protein
MIDKKNLKKDFPLIIKKISFYKKELSKVKNEDIYENFGQKEVRKIRELIDKNTLSYIKKMGIVEELNNFERWASCFNGCV